MPPPPHRSLLAENGTCPSPTAPPARYLWTAASSGASRGLICIREHEEAGWWARWAYMAFVAYFAGRCFSRNKLVPRTPYRRSLFLLGVLAAGCALLFAASHHPLAGVALVCVTLLLRQWTSPGSLRTSLQHAALFWLPSRFTYRLCPVPARLLSDSEMLLQSLQYTEQGLAQLRDSAGARRYHSNACQSCNLPSPPPRVTYTRTPSPPRRSVPPFYSPWRRGWRGGHMKLGSSQH